MNSLNVKQNRDSPYHSKRQSQRKQSVSFKQDINDTMEHTMNQDTIDTKDPSSIVLYRTKIPRIVMRAPTPLPSPVLPRKSINSKHDSKFESKLPRTLSLPSMNTISDQEYIQQAWNSSFIDVKLARKMRGVGFQKACHMFPASDYY
jgi:hypothetical protein